MALTGEYHHNLDSKGRVILPIKLRADQGQAIQSFTLTVGLEKCIAVYPVERWDNLNQEFKNIPWEDKSGRLFLREMYAKASPCEPDKQGRIFIPPQLRKYAQIEKEVVITGAGEHIEIWSKDNWADYEARAEQSLEDHAGRLTQYGKHPK